MRQPDLNCVAIFLSARRHAQGSELPTPSAGADYTDGEAHRRATLHTAKQAVDLFDRVHFGFADAVNYEPAFNSRFVRRAVGLDCGNQNTVALRVTERVA